MPLTHLLFYFSLSVSIGATCIITIVIWIIIELAIMFGVYGHQCSMGQGGCPTLSNMLVILVGGIPIAMPTVLSVTLALGAYKLAQKGAIVSRLTAIEEMAGMDMLCSDKTGTLTLNQLSVDKPNLSPQAPKFSPEDILFYGALGARTENEEPIDVCIGMFSSCWLASCMLASYMLALDALLRRARSRTRVLTLFCTMLSSARADKAYGSETLWDNFERLKYVPFNPVDKRTVATIRNKDSGEVFRAAKGAPQIILGMAHNLAEIKDEFEAKILEYAGRGYRALGVAMHAGASGDDQWEFVGLIPIFDPPRYALISIMFPLAWPYVACALCSDVCLLMLSACAGFCAAKCSRMLTRLPSLLSSTAMTPRPLSRSAWRWALASR